MRVFRLAVILAVTMSLVGCSFLFPPEEELLAPPLVEPEPVTYRTIMAGFGDIEQSINVYASFRPGKTASLAFEGLDGRVANIAAKLGQEVKEGDLLIELNSESIKRQIRQQQIEVEKAQLALETAQRTESESPSDFDMTQIERAKLKIRSTEEFFVNLEEDWVQATRENQPDSVMQELKRKLDAQRITITDAKLELESLQFQYDQWFKEQAVSGEDEERRQAQIRQAELDLKKQQNTFSDLDGDLKKAQLFAPFDGIVTYVSAALEVGQSIESYVTLFRISDPTQIVLTYSGDEAHQFSLGMDVTVTMNQETYSGKVAADPTTMPTIDGKMVNEVQFAIETIDDAVTMGDGAWISAVLRRRENVIVLPKNCINSFWGRRFINLLIDGVKVERDVEIGIETATEVEIVEGVQPGEEVITP